MTGSSKDKRYFQGSWLEEPAFESWLTYSKREDKAFCRICLFFPSIWDMLWRRLPLSADGSTKDIPKTVAATLLSKHFQPPLFPTFYKLLKLLATLPVTTCSCERSISQLRIIKNYSRATMLQDRFSELCLLHTHYDTAINFDRVLDDFGKANVSRTAFFLHKDLKQ